MAILKRRDKGKPFNTLTIRMSKGLYARAEDYARKTFQSLSLTIEDLVEKGLNSEGNHESQ